MKTKFAFLLLICLSLLSCKKDKGNTVDPPDSNYTQPVAYSDGLATASLDDVGLETLKFRRMMDFVNNTINHRIHNILVLKDNKLVFEEYFMGNAYSPSSPNRDGELMQYSRESDHFMASITKSVTSVLAGIALKKGDISSMDQKVIEFFPEYSDILLGDKVNITLEHLLTMTCGLTFDENTYPYGNPLNDVTQMFINEDPMRFILSKELVSTPGTTFFYNSGATNLIGGIIEKASGMRLLDFANDYLFTPLNTQGGAWEPFSSGHFFASGGLHLRAREILKIGTLFLNDGKWNGHEIITSDWISSSSHEHIGTPGSSNSDSYGYQWWIRNFSVDGTSHKCFYAAGWGHQYMFIIPDFEMIIVINSGNYAHEAPIVPFDLVQDYIMDAI